MSQKRKQKLLKRQKKKKKDMQRKVTKQLPDVLNQSESEIIEWQRKNYHSDNFKDGIELENISESISLRIGLPDIIIPNPIYKDNHDQDKEICDMILMYPETLVIYQVKHKKLNPEKDQSVIIGRADDTITKLRKQFSTFIDLYENDNLPLMKTKVGIKYEIKKEKFPNVILIGVISFPGMENFPEDKKIEMLNSYGEHRGYKLHLFDVDHYDKISLELDTPADFIRYLENRVRFYTGMNIGFTNELDYLAFFKANYDEFMEAQSDNVKLSIGEGIWDHYVKNSSKEIILRDKKNSLSYVFDLILTKVKDSIGFNPVEGKGHNVSLDPGTVEAYMAILLSSV